MRNNQKAVKYPSLMYSQKEGQIPPLDVPIAPVPYHPNYSSGFPVSDGQNPPSKELYTPLASRPNYSSTYPASNTHASKSLERSINAERFIPQHKRLQWNVFPKTLIVVGNGIDMENKALSDWLDSPDFRRSSYDLSLVNILQFVPQLARMFQEYKKNRSTVWFHSHFLNNHYLRTIQDVEKHITSCQHSIRILKSKFSFFAELEHPALYDIRSIRKTYTTNGNHYNENRIIRTTAESVARICDEIHKTDDDDQLLLEYQELHKLVCRDYIARTRMLVDIERDKISEDLNAYDIYSHKFEYIEIPPPSEKLKHCLACQNNSSDGFGNPLLTYCAYHFNLAKHNLCTNRNIHVLDLERRKYSERASIVKCNKQHKFIMETISRMTSIDKLVGHFTVPGVAEKRPLVSIGDLLRLRFRDNTTEVICEVAEVEVKTERVAVFLPIYKEYNPYIDALCFPKNRNDKYSKKTDYKNLGRFDIRFGLNQSRGYELFHKIICECLSDGEKNSKILRIIAPTKHNNKIVKKSDCRLHIGISNWYNKKLNPEQKNAVFDIVRNNHGNVPYMINGPAGTGKTTTVLESLIQVLRYEQSSKILVCAPSDTACDVIASRLLSKLPKKSNGETHKMLRVNWWSRNPASLPPVLLSCSPTESMSGLFKMPTPDQIQDASIIICQCFVAGCLEIGSRRPWMENHFTHVFMDESSQSFEYESLIPLLKVGSECSIVLAGDPKQLGPTVRSFTANQNGLALSLQERLMGLPLYKGNEFCVSTELLDNYRSHEVLLQVSSELFYNGNLRCKAPRKITSVCEGFELLPRADFPLLVYDVEGEEKNKIDTPSFFNIEECNTIMKLIKALILSTDRIDTGKISVITCFRAQVLKMREIFRNNGLASVNIGVVEDFQGQESSVVFISTVLTKRQKRWETGAKGGLGFMTDAKRFNVSITRANALCVIVGNLNFLENSRTYWTALIEHARRNNGITGEHYEKEEHKFDKSYEEDYGISHFLNCIKNLKLLGVGHEVDRYEMAMRGYFQDSPEWKVCL